MSNVWADRNDPVSGPVNLIERQELILQMFAEDKSLSIRKLCEKTGLSMVRLDSLLGGRASQTLCMSTLSLPLPQRFFNASRY